MLSIRCFPHLLSYAFPALSFAPPFSLTPFSYAHPVLSYAIPMPLRPSPLLSHAFPALSYTTRFLSYAPLLLLTWLSYSLAPLAQALIVHLYKEVSEYRHGKTIMLRHSLHMSHCIQVPENVLEAANGNM